MNKIIILAAGKGSRMNSELPKALVPLCGKPMIQYLLESIKNSGVDNSPILVVAPDNKELITSALLEYGCNYAIQEQQLGSGHAVRCARDKVNEDIKNILVLYNDHPLIQSDTIKRLIQSHIESEKKITMMTTKLKDFADWRKNFLHWGRVVREDGKISKIVEYKDASEQERLIKEVNPALFCFNKDWLWENIDSLGNNNNQKEYYLTDLIKIAFDQGLDINDIKIEAEESVGANSVEELKVVEKIYTKYVKK